MFGHNVSLQGPKTEAHWRPGDLCKWIVIHTKNVSQESTSETFLQQNTAFELCILWAVIFKKIAFTKIYGTPSKKWTYCIQKKSFVSTNKICDKASFMNEKTWTFSVQQLLRAAFNYFWRPIQILEHVNRQMFSGKDLKVKNCFYQNFSQKNHWIRPKKIKIREVQTTI